MSEKLNWKAAVLAGIAAGIVFMMLEMVLGAIFNGHSLWGPPRMVAAIAMGKGVLPPPAPFDFGVMMVAMIVHFILSIILGFVLGWIISNWRMSVGAAIGAGIVFGLIVYFIDFYLFTGIFPWFAMSRGGISIFSHAMFGLVLGWIYHAIASRHWVRARNVAGGR